MAQVKRNLPTAHARIVFWTILAIYLFTAGTAWGQLVCSDYSPGPWEHGKSPAEVAHQLMATTRPEDIGKLAGGDTQFVILCGSPQEAERAFAAKKGRTGWFASVVVIAVGADWIKVAAADDAVRLHRADYVFKTDAQMTSPPVVGERLDFHGTYSSYDVAAGLIGMKLQWMALPTPVIVRKRTVVGAGPLP